MLPARIAATVVVTTLFAACGPGGGRAALQVGGGGVPEPTTTSTAADPPPTTPPPTPPPTTPPPTSPPPTSPPPTPATTQPPPLPTTSPPSGLATVQIRLTRIGGFDQPTAMAVRAGDPTLYIAERTGRVRALRGSDVAAAPVLDLSQAVSTGTEQGLLGIAFSPNGSQLYVNYTDTDGDTRIVEYSFSAGFADAASRRELLVVDQPFSNHNGGNLVFGPDGRLWIGLGDGGSGGDPFDNAQNLGTLLGKMLRIDPRPGIGAPYTVPNDNPFVNMPGARPEIWAYGLRNPWRYSFDRRTGDLWIADVGQNAREEVDFQPASTPGGQNYGWARLEGSRPYSGVAPSNAVAPIYDYARSGGNCAITGGYVYRGTRIPDLAGAYVFADYCSGQIRALRQSRGQVVDERVFPASAPLITSFGEDQAGDLYVLSQEGGLFRIDPR